MPTIKPTKEGVLKKLDIIGTLRQRRERLDMIAKGKETEFWKALKLTLEESVKKQADIIDFYLGDNGDTSSDMLLASLKKAYGAKMQAEAVIALVETPEDFYQDITNKIKSLQEEIKNAEDSGVLEESVQ